MRTLSKALAIAVLALFAATPHRLAAQLLYGSMVGNVKDPSDAAIPGASVTITHKETNQTRQTVTNSTGLYSFPTIQSGVYELKVSKEGFRNATQENVTVTINTVSRVNVVLQVGVVAESVMVTAQAMALQTDRSEVRAEITSKAFRELPVPVGRNYQHLLKTIPGFRPPTNAHSVPTNPSRALTFNVNGVSYSINNTRIDGASSIAVWLPHATAFVPTLESIDTVNVVTNSFDAEQGLAGGAAINVQIKSGSNDLHGSLFEYHTNQRLKAKPFFLPQGRDKPKLVYNEFGGTLGGPIVKDKLFYFGSYEGTYDRQFASRFGTVPTAAIKRGDMSESPRVVYDPDSGNPDGTGRTPFPNNQVPARLISPISKKLADLTPLPNLEGLTNNYFAGGSYAFDRHRADTKVNWNISEKLTTFGRFSLLHYDMINPEMFGAVGGPQISGAGGNPGIGFGNTYSFTGAATYVFTPNLILDAYYGYTRMDTSVEQSRLDEKLGLDFLGIPGTNGTRRFEGGWPRFSISSYTNLGIDNAFMPYYRRDPQYQYVANFNLTKGSHEVRFGMDFYNTHMNHLQPEATGATHGAQGGFTFGGGPTTVRGGQSSNQFNSYATFLMGLPTTIGKITQVPDEYNTRQRNYSMYVRDRWNVSRKLTLSYGLRWEYFPFPTRADRGMERYDFTRNKMLVCGVGQIPKNCGVSVDKDDFAPRVGFAYRITDTFVMRAGYGITNDPFSLARPLRTNYPVLLIQNITAPNSFQPAGRLADGIPRAVAPDLGNGVLDLPGTFAVVTTDEKFPRGYIQSWNFTLQKELLWGFVGQAGYVATRSVRQLGYLDINAGQVIGAGRSGQPLNQQFGRTAATTLVTPFGTNRYDSLQATLERRFANGFQMGTAYTWSKVIGNNDNSDSGPAVRALRYFDRNHVVRGYDRTHNFQVTNIVELPFGPGKRWLAGGVGAALFGGWQVNSLLSLVTGTPFSVGSSGNSLDLPGSSQTADQVKPTVEKLGGVGKGQSYFDPLAFQPVTEARFGNTGHNILRGPGIANWDFGLFRRFEVTERYKLEFRMEAFNFTNTPHLGNPGTNVSNFNPTVTDPLKRFGGYTEITGIANTGRDGIDERQFRLGLRLSF
ncbi:MAG: TonB-dependent receptor [Acidobacteria bacterium]|nr:TonB-dependent receptor [Acidobacteriota bacterium]